MVKSKLTLSETFKPNDTFLLRDISWAFLFPRDWFEYRQKASLRNVAKLKVLSDDGEGFYTVEIMEIAPEIGRVVIPTGMLAKVNIHDIHVALMATHKSELD